MTLVDFMGHAAFSDKLPMELSDGRNSFYHKKAPLTIDIYLYAWSST